MSQGLFEPLLSRAPARIACVLVVACLLTSIGRAQNSYVVLKDGLKVGPGAIIPINTLNTAGKVNSNAEVSAKLITKIDDGLRLIHFCNKRVVEATPAQPPLKIKFLNNESEIAKGDKGVPISGIAQTTPFDAFGRRYYITPTRNAGVVRFIQGITEISPEYVRVQTLRTENDKNEYEWDMRLSLDSFDSETLIKILVRNADRTKPGDWLDIVNLFAASKKYQEARFMLAQAILKLAELESQKPQLKQFDQLMADQIFEGAQNAQNAQQFNYAKLVLQSMKPDVLSLETQIKLNNKLDEFDKNQAEREQLIRWIQEDTSKLMDGELKNEYLRVVQEIADNLTPVTIDRLSDYIRRHGDANLRPEQRAAVALSGWLFGPTIGEDNYLVVGSGIKARRIISEYLNSRRPQLIEELTKLEAGNARLIAKTLEYMPPPMKVPENTQATTLVSSGDATQPPREVAVPGRHLLEVTHGKNLEKKTYYLVQLPPEYNPYQRYPCVLTLQSEYSSPQDQLEWWVGPFDPSTPDQRCLGEASKRGYIVVSPYWMREKQTGYDFTENEQANILVSLRDAMKHFSIDSDRIFVSGHYCGATAAWDLALSKPDMWAGCVAVGPVASKYIVQYWPNGVYVPSYFVAGEYDPNLQRNAQTWDNQLKKDEFNILVTLYRERGLDHYQEELPRIMEWMSFKRRPTPAPDTLREFAAVTSRAGDRFFWWFETEALNDTRLVHPLLYKAGSEYEIKSRRNPDNNSISLDSVPAKKYTIWLSPEVVDFSKNFVTIEKKRIEPKPDIREMLEDARTRVDRQHPFWMRVDFPR